MGPNKRIKAHYYTDKGLIDVIKCLYFFDSTHFRPIEQKSGKKFVGPCFGVFEDITISFSDFLIFRNVTLDFT